MTSTQQQPQVSEYVANIRRWQEADKALKARETWNASKPEDDAKNLAAIVKAQKDLDNASIWFTGVPHKQTDALAAFTALADALEAAQAERDSLQARVDAALAIDEWNTEASLGYQTDFANGACMMRETIRKALTASADERGE